MPVWLRRPEADGESGGLILDGGREQAAISNAGARHNKRIAGDPRLKNRFDPGLGFSNINRRIIAKTQENRKAKK
jgi:hypothetical protein